MFLASALNRSIPPGNIKNGYLTLFLTEPVPLCSLYSLVVLLRDVKLDSCFCHMSNILYEFKSRIALQVARKIAACGSAYNHLQNKRDTNAPAPPMLVSECEHHFRALD